MKHEFFNFFLNNIYSVIGKDLKEDHKLHATSLKHQIIAQSKEMSRTGGLFVLRIADHQEHEIETYHAFRFCSRQTFYVTGRTNKVDPEDLTRRTLTTV